MEDSANLCNVCKLPNDEEPGAIHEYCSDEHVALKFEEKQDEGAAEQPLPQPLPQPDRQYFYEPGNGAPYEAEEENLVGGNAVERRWCYARMFVLAIFISIIVLMPPVK